MNKQLLAAGAAFVALIVFWVAQSKNAPMQTIVDQAEGRAGDSLAAMQKFDSALAEARQMLQAGQPLDAALKLYHEYPAFEAALHAEGFKEIEPGLTLSAWFERKKTDFAPALAAAYAAHLERLKNGDAGWREMDQFLNHTPFPFIDQLARRYRNEDRPAVETARAARASNWCFVSVIATTGDGQHYERIVRDALRAKGSAQPDLKLVFDSPASGQETAAAAKIIDVRIEEKFAAYAFEGKHAGRGSGNVAERALVHFSSRARKSDSFRCNWEQLPALAVTNEAPDKLKFKFENDRQTADFSAVAARQREALLQKLSGALQAVPQFEVAPLAARR